MPSSPVATALFLAIQAVSIAISGAGIAMYLRILKRHRLLMVAIDPGAGRLPGHGVGLAAWAYVAFTVVVTALASVIFFWQPHIL
jgi:NAD/NADP transhydrogenase beta subunit